MRPFPYANCRSVVVTIIQNLGKIKDFSIIKVPICPCHTLDKKSIDHGKSKEMFSNPCWQNTFRTFQFVLFKCQRHRRVIEVFGGDFVLSLCFLEFSVGVRAFVIIGLSQIWSFFSLNISKLTLWLLFIPSNMVSNLTIFTCDFKFLFLKVCLFSVKTW